MVHTNLKPCVLRATCPSRDVLGLIADKWTVLVLYSLAENVKRYNQIQREVENISQKVLTATLRKLERDGIIKRTVYPVVPPKVEYQLTALGKSLLDILESLTKWAERHLQDVQRARERFQRS